MRISANTQRTTNDYGLEIYELGIDEEFSLTSQMLNDEGNKILSQHYVNWLKNLRYGETPSLELLNDHYGKYCETIPNGFMR